MTVVDAVTDGEIRNVEELRLIDTDVHPNMPQGMHTLAPYMTKEWVKRLGISDKPSVSTRLSNTGEFIPPHNSIYTSLHGSTRLDVVPEDGSVTASTPAMVTEQLLDAWDIDRAVLLPANVFGLGAIPNADIANTIASATNDYIDDVWISADRRYRSGIVACPQDPIGAAKEIRRMAVKRGGVQVLLPAYLD